MPIPHSQEANLSLHIEIKDLKEALAASEQRADRYGRLISTLYDELDDLRERNICHVCKKNVDPTSGGLGSSGTSPILKVASQTKNKPLPVPPARPAVTSKMTHSAAGVSLATNPGFNEQTPKQKSELPVDSAALDLQIAHIFTYDSRVYFVKISPDGQRLAIELDVDGETYINEVKKESKIRVQYSPDGQRLVKDVSDNRFIIWDIAQSRMLAMKKGQPEHIAFSPDSRFLFSVSDRTIRVCDMRDCSSKKLSDCFQSSVASSPDDEPSASTLPWPQSPSCSATSSPAMPSPIPKIASQTRDKPLPIPPGPAATLNPSTSETTLGAPHPGFDEQTTTSPKPESGLPEWSVAYNPEVKQALDLQMVHVLTYESPVYCVKMSPDGQRVAMGLEDDGRTYIHEVETGSAICVFMDHYTRERLTIYSVQFSPDGRLLATASDKHIRIWDIVQRRMRAMFKGHTEVAEAIAFSPDGRSLVSASNDHSVRIWNIRDGSSRRLSDGADYFQCVAFSPDGRYIAAGDFDDTLRVWDVVTQKLVARWRGHTDSVWCLAFAPDGKGLMSGSSDTTLKYWDLSSLGTNTGTKLGQMVPEIRSFKDHTDCIRFIAFFPGNSRWVLTCAQDRSVRLWDTDTGVWQLVLEGHTDVVRVIDLNQAKEFLATASRDCRAILWKYFVL